VNRFIGGTVAGALAGLALGFQLWGGEQPVVETPAPAVRQPDQSLVLERRPDPAAKPAHQLPKGAVLERVATVIVQPNTSELAKFQNSHNRITASPACSCAPVHVDLSLVRLEDGTRRVVASARGGSVIGGVDVPVESAAPRRVLRWSAGAAWDTQAQRWGGYVDRDYDRVSFVPLPVRVGVMLTPSRDGQLVAGVRIGLRF
jgi:hypothetical protein